MNYMELFKELSLLQISKKSQTEHCFVIYYHRSISKDTSIAYLGTMIYLCLFFRGEIIIYPQITPSFRVLIFLRLMIWYYVCSQAKDRGLCYGTLLGRQSTEIKAIQRRLFFTLFSLNIGLPVVHADKQEQSKLFVFFLPIFCPACGSQRVESGIVRFARY